MKQTALEADKDKTPLVTSFKRAFYTSYAFFFGSLSGFTDPVYDRMTSLRRVNKYPPKIIKCLIFFSVIVEPPY